MTIAQALSSLASGIPRLDAELLLCAAIGRDRPWLIAHGDDEFNDRALQLFNNMVRRRSTGEPLAYIVGEKEFFGRTFVINSSVLTPRPATEGLVEAAKEFFEHPQPMLRNIDSGIVALGIPLGGQQPTIIVDIGTGSGVIAISLSFICDAERIIATDASAAALEVARENVRALAAHSRVACVCESEMETVRSMDVPFIVVTNPPYIPLHSPDVDPSVSTFEPSMALFAGDDGLDVIRKMIGAAKSNLHCCGIMMECRSDQVQTIRALCDER